MYGANVTITFHMDIHNTKHYTRTFLGSKLDPRGDSGQVWGIGLVPAPGTYCSDDVWLSYTHKVYYGTTKN